MQSETKKAPEATPAQAGIDTQTEGLIEAPLETAFRIVAEAAPPPNRERVGYRVCPASEIPIGTKRLFTIPGTDRSLGIVHLESGFYALRDLCPHMGAPLCEGTLHGTHLPGALFEFTPGLTGRILRCPWHGWEFDVVTGKALYDNKSRVATYPVDVDGEGAIVVYV